LVGLDDAAGVGEGGEALVQGGGTDAATAARRGERHGADAVGKCRGDALVERARARRGHLGRVGDLQPESGPSLSKPYGDGRQRRRGPMLHGEREVIAIAAQIEVGVAQGVELG
jgi:hypothetical protein